MSLNKNMALKKRGSEGDNLDERIKASIENATSSTAYTEALKNLSEAPKETPAKVPVESPAVPDTSEEPTMEAAMETVVNEKPAPKKKSSKKSGENNTGRGRKPKAEIGEVCRVQFSSTLEPDLLNAIRARAKKERIPFSCLVEKAFEEYLTNH